jgi:hypothetical protein
MESGYCLSSSEGRIDFRISITIVHLDTLVVSTVCSTERLVARKSYQDYNIYCKFFSLSILTYDFVNFFSFLELFWINYFIERYDTNIG